MDTNKTSSNPQQDTYSTPFIILPFASVPNLPFAQFDFSQLNQETVFNTVLKNRSLAYFGENSYSYNGIKHNSNPIPVSDKYLCTILEHLRNVLPDFEYNSILISKYCDGTDSLGFHCDNELEIVEQSDIVTVSLGETRTAKFRALSGSGNSCPEQSLALEHGHCFVMSTVPELFSTLNKLSTSSQKAVVLSYPGATVNGVLAKLKTDPKFAEINPQHVQKIYLFCGTNNIDKTLNIPFHRNSDFIETGQFRASESAINSVKAEFSELINFLHYWANCANINILNILPRESSTRNIVINHINEFIFNLSSRYTYVEMISTEKHRNLFTFKNCFRKQVFFADRGEDNVHLNNLGVVRLAKYLKYFAHHRYNAHSST